MKKIVGIDQDFGGGDVKGSAAGQLGIEGSDLVAEIAVKARYPLAKVVDPVMKVVDDLVDKVEKLIPGDQTMLAAGLKADARAAIVKAISESVPEPVQPA
jgi:hypothetical protein